MPRWTRTRAQKTPMRSWSATSAARRRRTTAPPRTSTTSCSANTGSAPWSATGCCPTSRYWMMRWSCPWWSPSSTRPPCRSTRTPSSSPAVCPPRFTSSRRATPSTPAASPPPWTQSRSASTARTSSGGACAPSAPTPSPCAKGLQPGRAPPAVRTPSPTTARCWIRCACAACQRRWIGAMRLSTTHATTAAN